MLKALKTTVGLMAATTAVLALPATAAAAEYLVPPGNSAAIQYTETYPSAGGHRDAENQSRNRNRSPSKVLGERNAQRLKEHGPEGEAVAEVVAETAPTTPAAQSESSSGGDDSDGNEPEKRKRDDGERSPAGAAPGSGNSGGPDRPQPTVSGDVDQSGSSGFGEVLASAVGAPAGGAGIILPLAFLGTLAWMLVLTFRQRKKQSAA
jgi:hypothetical protein